MKKRIITLLIISFITCLRTFGQVPSYVATSGLLAWYAFNNNANDEHSGYNNGVSYGGVSYGTDRFGAILSCYNGNGSSGIDIPVNNFPSGNAARSVAAWFKQPIPAPSSYRQIFATGNNVTPGTRFGLTALNSVNRVGWESVGVTRLAPLVTDSSWHHVVVTYPSTGGGTAGVKVYYDGVLATPVVVGSVASFTTATGPFHHIGALFMPVSSGSWLYSWIGSLDDIGVWNRAITPCEVSYLYYGGNPSLAFIGGASQTLTVCQNSAAVSINTLLSINELNVGITNTWSTLTPPSHGVLVASYSATATGSPIVPTGLSYTPTAGYTGSDSFSVIVTDCNNTIDTTTVYINVIPAGSPAVITGPSSVCVGSTISLSATPGSGTWTATNGHATVSAGTVTGISMGVDTIIYSVTGSCGFNLDTLIVNVNNIPPNPTFSGTTTFCQYTPYIPPTVTGSGILWYNSATGGTGLPTPPTVSTATIGSYSFWVSQTVGGCESSRTIITITISPAPVAGTVSGPSIVCPGTGVSYVSTGTTGTWSSSSPSILTINASTGSGGGVTNGTAIITYSVTNSCGTATDTQLVVVSTVPSAGTISGPSSVCPGATISLFTGVAGGSWSSSTPSIASVGGLSGIVYGVSTGTTIISYTVSNSCGTATATTAISVNALPDAGLITGPRNVCEQKTLLLTNSATGGTWISSSPGIAVVAGGTVTALTTGSAIISYSIINACGTSVDTHAIVVNPLPNPGTITGSSSTLCEGLSISLVASITGGAWISNDILVATINTSGVVDAHAVGVVTFYYVVTNGYGCSDSSIYSLSVVDQASLITTAVVQQPTCFDSLNGSIALSTTGGSGSYAYNWVDGSGTSYLSGLSAGGISVTITDQTSGCKDTQNFHLTLPEQISLQQLVINATCKESNGAINITGVTGGVGPYIFNWSNGVTSTSLANIPTGLYTLTVKDVNQCKTIINITVSEDSCYDIIIHDVITPNGDGINDVWVIEGIELFPDNSVEVFDKWGDIVFASKGYKNSWGGSGKGGMLPDGTYFYLVKVSQTDLTSLPPQSGSILIKR